MQITANGTSTMKVFPGDTYVVNVTGFDAATSGSQTILQSHDGNEPTVENTFTSNDSYEFRAVSKQIRFVTTGLGSGDALKVSLFRAT